MKKLSGVIAFIFLALISLPAQDTATHTNPAGFFTGLPTDVGEAFNYQIFGYPIWRLSLLVAIFILTLVITKLIKRLVNSYSRRLEKHQQEQKKTFVTSTVLATKRAITTLIWSGVLWIIALLLLPEHAKGALWLSATLFNVSYIIFLYDFVAVIDYYFIVYVQREDNKLDDTLVPIVRNGLRILVIIIAVIQLYQNFSGQSITTVLAGLGLAGMAVALAAQETLKNFFGFITIVFDKPFKLGDRVEIDSHDGFVEKIGVRSTVIRRLDGHSVSVPNNSVTTTAIHNIGRRPYIRRKMNIGIPYDTTPAKVEKAVEIISTLLANHEGMDSELPPRVYFKEFNADSLNIFAIYWYHPPDYWSYMTFSQKLNLDIMRAFAQEGIEFAFPTQTIYLAGDENRELSLNLPGLEKMPKKPAGKRAP